MSTKPTKTKSFSMFSIFKKKSEKPKDKESEKPKDTNNKQVEEDSIEKPRRASFSKAERPKSQGEQNVEPPSTSNGRGSHNNNEVDNVSGENNVDLSAKTRRPSVTTNDTADGGRKSPTPSTTPSTTPTPPSALSQEENTTGSRRKSAAGLSPDEVSTRRKSPSPRPPPPLEVGYSNQKDTLSADSTGECLYEGSSKGELEPTPTTRERKKSSATPYVPPVFRDSAPRTDTPPTKHRPSGPPEILPEDVTYEPSDLMGHGSFGSVYKGRCRGQEVAVKVPKKQKLSVAELTSFRNEVKMMSVIFHPHVVLFLGACTQVGKMQIVTERCMTDLEKYLASDRERKQVSLSRRMQMARDAALGVNWLHSKNRIVHLDLKSANLLLDHNLRVKVTDFGFSQLKDTLTSDKSKKGTPLWMAPEVMMGNKYDEKADVYSFGIILWEILTRDVPYAHHNDYATFFRAVCIDEERPPIPPDTLPSLTHLITTCWAFDPKTRPTFEEIIFRLNVVLIDCAIESEDGREIWKTNFLLPKQELVEQVPWVEFDSVIRKSLGKDNLNLDNLRSLLVSPPKDPLLKGKEVVTPERFDKVIKWFGPFFNPVVGPGIIAEVNELVTKGWFHADIPKEEAMDRLAKQEEGTFLIRLSSTDPKASPFTLSMTNNEHRRIRRIYTAEGGTVGYKIQGKGTTYSSLVDLAEKCVDYNLTNACPKKSSGGYNPYDPYGGMDMPQNYSSTDLNNNNNSSSSIQSITQSV